ncbi:MAG: hypothetical protein JSS75_04395 [Bacteroidetes bacterium]|nr:hypothetical protein [Bacteroidota bacterium]
MLKKFESLSNEEKKAIINNRQPVEFEVDLKELIDTIDNIDTLAEKAVKDQRISITPPYVSEAMIGTVLAHGPTAWQRFLLLLSYFGAKVFLKLKDQHTAIIEISF